MILNLKGEKPEYKVNRLGFWTLVGTWLLLVFIAQTFDLFPPMWDELSAFLNGNVSIIPTVPIAQTDILLLAGFVAALTAVKIPVGVVVGLAANTLAGKTKGEHAAEDFMGKMGEGNHFMDFFLMVLAEELFARALFLGVIPYVLHRHDPATFYILFLVGNFWWAYIHIKNFDEGDRQLLRIVPQFVGGIFLTYAFVKYGLLGSVIAHFAYNAVLFSLCKLQRFGEKDIMLIFWNGCVAVGSWLFISKPLTDLRSWFTSEPVFQIPGWHFPVYPLAIIFLSAVLSLVIDLLMYDRPLRDDEKKIRETDPFTLFILSLGVTGVLLGLFWLSGLVLVSVPVRIVCISILLAFANKMASTSACSRVFWECLTKSYLTLGTVLALGWVYGAVLSLMFFFLSFPEYLITKDDD
ncbi:MAG: hypothetical protein ACAH35_00985 [Candidatus Paceibacterota bacterium]